MFQRIELIGRVGRDPETRYTGSGVAVANFSLATTEKYKDKNGEKQEKTVWWKLTAWGKLAEIVQSYVVKGQLIMVAGTGDNREWTDKEGQKRTSFEVRVNEMKMLSKSDKKAEAKTNNEDNSAGGDFSDEDIPF
jgi:single-strand DNA-binding protein